MLISVIIPAYNQGQYLRQAIESVLNQTCQDFEIIVVDDGSTDDTQQAARSFDDPRLSYVYQSNRGLSAARNTGIRKSSGELITFLDSDDLFLPQKLEILSAELERRHELGFVAGQAVPIDENGEKVGQIISVPIPEPSVRLLLWNPLHVGSTLVRREWLDCAGYFDENLRAYEDWDMWLRLARCGCSMGWVAQPVSLYRFHTRQMTQDRQRMTTATFAVLEKVYSDPGLPQDWLALKDAAYSNAFIRDAVQAYRLGDLAGGAKSLAEAVRLDPGLAEKRGDVFAKRLAALSDSPKISNRLEFIEQVYNHLPDALAGLRKRKNSDLGALSAQLGFDANRRGDRQAARAFFWKAVRYEPKWLANRGVLAILLSTR